MTRLRFGIGYDIHRTDPDRPLLLCGVAIPDAPFGLAGHSDADVALHAVADACLGAAGLGDIGTHFPDTDPAWAGADSAGLLTAVVGLVGEAGFAVGNVDVTVIAERPRLAEHVSTMRARLAELLNIPTTAASVKATTHERLGPLGREEGIAALAVAGLVPAAVEDPDAGEVARDGD
jgi:2-C-methyl-D-erythritol 2,4-cyclodiphosphate synthase